MGTQTYGDTEPQGPGAMGTRSHKDKEPWVPGATEIWSHGDTEPKGPGATGTQSHGDPEQWGHRARGTQSHRDLEPQGPGTMGTRSHGDPDLWGHRATGTLSHRDLEPRGPLCSGGGAAHRERVWLFSEKLTHTFPSSHHPHLDSEMKPSGRNEDRFHLKTFTGHPQGSLTHCRWKLQTVPMRFHNGINKETSTIIPGNTAPQGYS